MTMDTTWQRWIVQHCQCDLFELLSHLAIAIIRIGSLCGLFLGGDVNTVSLVISELRSPSILLDDFE